MNQFLVDQSSDLSQTILHEIIRSYDLGDFEKVASSPEARVSEDASSFQFADQVNRLFPVHNSNALLASAVYYYGHTKKACEESQQRYIESFLKQAAGYYGLVPELNLIESKTAQKEARIDSDQDYAFVWEEKGEKVRRYPIRNVGELKEAARYLRDNRDDFTYAEARQLAHFVCKKASELNHSVPDENLMKKIAGYGFCSKQTVIEEISKRMTKLADQAQDEAVMDLGKLAFMVHETEDSTLPSSLVKTAILLDKVDRQFGLVPEERIEEVFFVLNEKRASDLSDNLVSTSIGSVYQIDHICQVPLEPFRIVLGKEFSSRVSKEGLWWDKEAIAKHLPTLSQEEAGRFQKIAGEFGVLPSFIQRSQPLQISSEILTDLIHMASS